MDWRDVDMSPRHYPLDPGCELEDEPSQVT